MKKTSQHATFIPYIGWTTLAISVAAAFEYLAGRVIRCKCGVIKLWYGTVWSSENSQHLADWYTFSHIIHGFIFYYFGKLFKKLTLLQTFVLALFIESGWEILENSSFIINRYRSTTISLDYFGDSIVNSCTDILAMAFGFYIAKKLPLWAVVFLTFIMEVSVGYLIRDNLFLNIIMLLFPLPVIRDWQLTGR